MKENLNQYKFVNKLRLSLIQRRHCIWKGCGKIHTILPYYNAIQLAYCREHQMKYREMEAMRLEANRIAIN